MMIKWIKEKIPAGSTILEIGSGEGTKLLLDAGYNVISIENDPEYYGKYHDNYILAPIIGGWYDHEAIAYGLYGRKYDLIIVDGPKGSKLRGGFYKHRDIFSHSVPILIDDTVRAVENAMALDFEKAGFSRKRIKDGTKSFDVLIPEKLNGNQ